MSPEDTYLHHLPTIDRIAGGVARQRRLNADDAEEFTQEVKFRLLDDNYAIIRKFEGRSAFSTYLTTVIIHLHQQWRVQMWGKWRPSAEARRLGDKAIKLERMLTRDGFTFDEAIQDLTMPADSPYTVAELELIYLRLPVRNPRPVLVSDEVTPEVAAVDTGADDRVEMHERERSARHVVATADGLFETMDPEDRLILQMRFWQGRKVPDIARRLGIDQKKLYKRLDRIFAALRRDLEKAGCCKTDIDTLLTHGDQEIRFEFPHDPVEIRESGPSHPPGGEGEGVRGRKGRKR